VLLRSKEEHPVVDDGPAERAAKLVALQPVIRRGEEIVRVEPIVPRELEGVPMEEIGTGLGDDIHGRSKMLAIPGRQGAGFYLELLQRIGKRRRKVQVVEWIVVGAAIHDVGNAV